MPYFVTAENNATVLCLTFNESMYTYAQDFNYKGGGDGEGGGGEAMQVYWVFIDKSVCNISES